MILRLFLLFILSEAALAAPETLEVWFLSAGKVAELKSYLDRPAYIFRKPTAELECQEMGDYCFDPQFGLYKKDHEDEEVRPQEVNNKKDASIAPAKSLERDLINCDKKNYFDIFCGKAKPTGSPKKAKLDLWIDTSSSMKEFDFSDKAGGCFRKSLMQRLDASCPFNQKVNVMMFDTSIKQAGSMDTLCHNQGLNDYKRLMDWIERSDAKHLVVITDIYEFHKEFSDFIESKNGKLKGDKDPLTGADLLNLVDDLAKSCK